MFDSNDKILDMTKYNKRVKVIDEGDIDIMFKMYERVAVKNKVTSYGQPLLGIWENKLLSEVFFCSENEQILQNGLRAGVYNKSNEKYVIAQQNVEQLRIVMRSIYAQFAQPKQNDITKQIEMLNQLVLDYCIPYVYSESVGYVKYLRDQGNLVIPFDHPQKTDREYKQLQQKTWIMKGMNS